MGAFAELTASHEVEVEGPLGFLWKLRRPTSRTFMEQGIAMLAHLPDPHAVKENPLLAMAAVRNPETTSKVMQQRQDLVRAAVVAVAKPGSDWEALDLTPAEVELLPMPVLNFLSAEAQKLATTEGVAKALASFRESTGPAADHPPGSEDLRDSAA